MLRLLAAASLILTAALPAMAQETTKPAEAPKVEEAKPKTEAQEEARSPFLSLGTNFLFRGKRSHAELRSSDVLRGGPNFNNRGTARALDR